MPRGHEDDPVHLHQYLRALFGPKIIMGKKDRCAVFGYNMRGHRGFVLEVPSHAGMFSPRAANPT